MAGISAGDMIEHTMIVRRTVLKCAEETAMGAGRNTTTVETGCTCQAQAPLCRGFVLGILLLIWREVGLFAECRPRIVR